MPLRIPVASVLVSIATTCVAASTNSSSSSSDTYTGFWLFFLIVFVLGVGACFFFGIASYGRQYHVHRSYFEERDSDGRLIHYGYRSDVDADTDVDASPPKYAGHAAYYGHSYEQFRSPPPPPSRRAVPPVDTRPLSRFARV